MLMIASLLESDHSFFGRAGLRVWSLSSPPSSFGATLFCIDTVEYRKNGRIQYLVPGGGTDTYRFLCCLVVNPPEFSGRYCLHQSKNLKQLKNNQRIEI